MSLHVALCSPPFLFFSGCMRPFWNHFDETWVTNYTCRRNGLLIKAYIQKRGEKKGHKGRLYMQAHRLSNS